MTQNFFELKVLCVEHSFFMMLRDDNCCVDWEVFLCEV